MYTRIDDQFYMTIKNAQIDRDEQDLYIAGIVFCNGQLTDGFIPAARLPMLAAWAKLPGEANIEAIASRLVEHEYWEVVDGGYMVHDFLDWSISREEVLALRETRSQAGRRGGLRSGAVRKAKQEAKAEAIASAKAKQKGTHTQSLNLTSSGSSGAVPAPEKEPETPTSLSEDEPLAERPDHLITAMALYHNTIGFVAGSRQGEEITDYIDRLHAQGVDGWWAEALKEAADANVRNWKYVRSILDRCLTQNVAPSVQPAKPRLEVRNGGRNGHNGWGKVNAFTGGREPDYRRPTPEEAAAIAAALGQV